MRLGPEQRFDNSGPMTDETKNNRLFFVRRPSRAIFFVTDWLLR